MDKLKQSKSGKVLSWKMKVLEISPLKLHKIPRKNEFPGTFLSWNIQPWTFLSGNFPPWNFISRKILAFLTVYGLGKVFTLTFFWLMPFPLSSNQNEKGYFPYVSSEKTYSLLCFSAIFGGIKNIQQFLNFYLHQIYLLPGKAELSMDSCSL